MTSVSTGPGTAAGNLRGTGWMLLTGLFFVGVTGLVRHLGTDMSPIQAAFIRYAFGFVLMIPVFMRLETLRPSNGILGLYLSRGLLHGIGVSLWFFAMARIPIAEVTALGFTTPIFTTIGAALFLNEKLRIRRIGAVLVAFGGVLFILRPGFEAVADGDGIQHGDCRVSIDHRHTGVAATRHIGLAHADDYGAHRALLRSGVSDRRSCHPDQGFPVRRDHRDPTGAIPAACVGDAAWPSGVWRATGFMDLGRRRHHRCQRDLHRPSGDTPEKVAGVGAGNCGRSGTGAVKCVR
jgi:uncharacterized membrane protein